MVCSNGSIVLDKGNRNIYIVIAFNHDVHKQYLNTIGILLIALYCSTVGYSYIHSKVKYNKVARMIDVIVVLELQ